MNFEDIDLSIFGSWLFLGMLVLAGLEPAVGQSQSRPFWPLSKVRADTNRDNKLDYLGEELTVAGIANTASGQTHSTYLQAFIQNDDYGIPIFDKTLGHPFEAGDSLVVKGKLHTYDGMDEIHVDSYQVFDMEKRLKPRPLSKVVENPERYLGMLAKGTGTIIEQGNIDNGRYLKLRVGEANSTPIWVFVSNFHKQFQEFDFSKLGIGDMIHVKGAIGEYRSNPDEKRIYQLYLRSPQDLTYAGLPRYYLLIGIGVLVLIAIVVVGWIISLRRQVDNKTRKLQQSLQEKDALLREIHHRVKNSLSIVSGLIGLQLDSTKDENAKTVLKDSQSRIQSVALIHEKLYHRDAMDNVKLDDYIKELVEAIHGTFTEYQEAVDLQFDMDTLEVDVDKAIPCGLLINELVVNAFKHAFTEDRQGLLQIRLERENGSIELTVADNGPGLPDDFSLSNSGSLGTMLINTFASQLEAETKITESSQGTEFLFRFTND